MRTRTYSKTKYIASFVGFAPVNNPAITIAVIIDSPTVGSHFGHAVSAPVFQELAQEILEYLGVPHDHADQAAQVDRGTEKKTAHDDADGDREQVGDLDAMFAEVNHLPTGRSVAGAGREISGDGRRCRRGPCLSANGSDAIVAMPTQPQEYGTSGNCFAARLIVTRMKHCRPGQEYFGSAGTVAFG